MGFIKRLDSLMEAVGRYRPAVIRMKRGTVIEADHVREVRKKNTGEVFLVVGFGPIVGPTTKGRAASSRKLIYNLPDFIRWWWKNKVEGREEMFYSGLRYKKRFKKIITINPKNVASLDYR